MKISNDNVVRVLVDIVFVIIILGWCVLMLL